jgi:hypothetical protein
MRAELRRIAVPLARVTLPSTPTLGSLLSKDGLTEHSGGQKLDVDTSR